MPPTAQCPLWVHRRRVIIATDGRNVWGAVLDERAHKADNQACRSLSRRACVGKLMSTLEAATTTSGGGAASGAVEVVMRDWASPDSSVARLRVASVGSEHGEAADAHAPAVSPASLPASQTGAASRAAAVRRVYLSTFVDLERLGPRHEAGLLRMLCGPRLAMANRTARAVRERQSLLGADAAEAARLAARVAEQGIEERSRLITAAVALVNAKKERLAELDERAGEAERQRAEFEAMARGLEGDLAKLRRRLERADAVAEASTASEGLAAVRNVNARAAARIETATSADVTQDGMVPRAAKRRRQGGAVPRVGVVGASESGTEEDGAAWDSDGSENPVDQSSVTSDNEDDERVEAGVGRRPGVAVGVATAALSGQPTAKRARLRRRVSSEDDLERRASGDVSSMVVGALAALRRRGDGLARGQPAAVVQAARSEASAVSRASSDDSLQ